MPFPFSFRRKNITWLVLKSNKITILSLSLTCGCLKKYFLVLDLLKHLAHPKWTSKNPDIFDSIQKFWLQFTMMVYEKIYWEHKWITNTSGPEIIVHNCSFHWADPNYIEYFQYTCGCLWYSQIFQQEVGLSCEQCWKSVKIRGIHRCTGKIPM